MKIVFRKMKESGLFVFVILLVCSLLGITGADAVAADALSAPKPTYGDQILDENGVAIEGNIDLTDAIVKAPELISKHFVQEVVRLDPYSYPTMVIMKANTKWKKKAKVKDHIISVPRIMTPPVQVTVSAAVSEAAVGQVAVNFGTSNGIIGLHQTILFKGVHGYEDDGVTDDGHLLQCRVVARDPATSYPILKPTNGKLVGGVKTLPNIAAGTMALRGDRIGTETQIRTEQFGILPSPTDYYVPKKLIEFGTSGWYDNASKNIQWGDAEIKETAMTEFLRTSAPAFWLGKQANMNFPEYKSNTPEMTLYAEGLMYQAGRDLDLQGVVNIDSLIRLQQIAFKDNNSGPVKLFAMGSELSPLFQKIILETTGLNVSVYRNSTLNIDFSEIVFAGGKRIRFIDDPSLDDCGLNDKGFILDPKWAAVYSYLYEILPLDGKKMQERDTSGMSIIDESVNVLLNQDANVVVTL